MHWRADTGWMTAGPSNRCMVAGVSGRTADKLSDGPTACAYTSTFKKNPRCRCSKCETQKRQFTNQWVLQGGLLCGYHICRNQKAQDVAQSPIFSPIRIYCTYTGIYIYSVPRSTHGSLGTISMTTNIGHVTDSNSPEHQWPIMG